MPLKFDETICPQNHVCPLIDICPAGAIYQKDAHSLPSYDPKKCITCELCVASCKLGAVSVIKIQ
ncbi:MAG: 4Fe-4S binding protein [Rikenellaceae bacterium]